MGVRQTDKLRGLVVHDSRITSASLAPNDASATGSDYSEAEPRPGGSFALDANAKLKPEISGDQESDADGVVTRGGNPNALTGAALAFRARGASDDTWLGWSPPNWIAGDWMPIEWTLLDIDDNEWDAVTRKQSQEVIAVYRIAAGLITVKRFHPSDGQDWALLGTIPGTTGGGSIAIGELPSGRLLVFSSPDTWKHSDDGGVTWADHSDAFISLDANPRVTMAVDRDLVALFGTGQATDQIIQHVSRDLGATFDVVDQGLLLGTDPVAKSVPGGGLAVAFEDTNGDYAIRVLDDATQAISVPVTVNPDAGTLLTQRGLHVDDDGVFYAFGKTGANDDEVGVYRSEDTGATWLPYQSGLLRLNDPTANVAVAARVFGTQGYVLFLFQWVSNALTVRDGSLGAFICGGFENVEAGGADNITVPANEINRVSWGGPNGFIWFPMDLPDGLAPWVQGGAISSGSITVDGELSLVTAVGEDDFYTEIFGAQINAAVKITLRVPSGGATTTNDLGAILRIANGTVEYEVEINVAANQFAIFDANGIQIGSTQVFGFVVSTPDKVEIIAVVPSSGIVKTAWRVNTVGPDSFTTPWTLGPTGSLTNIGPGAAAARIRFGHNLPTNSASVWGLVAVTFDPGDVAHLSNVLGSNLLGKRLGSVFPVPIPGVGSRAESAFLALGAGPGQQAERYDLDAAHDHPVGNLFPDQSPNPKATWRDDDESGVEQIFTFDLVDISRLGHSWTLVLLGLMNNYKTMLLEIDTSGAGAWSTLGTWNAATGFEALRFLRTGDTLRPDKGFPTPTAGRFLHKGEARNGVAVAGGVARTILFNAAGRWTDGDTVDPLIRIENPTGFPASGVVDLLMPRGLLSIHLTGAVGDYSRRFRVRIPGTVTPSAYKELGILLLGAFSPLGQQWSRGYSQQMRPNVERRDSPAGTIRKRQLGDPSLVWNQAWPDGVKMDQIRQSTAPDYLGSSIGAPLVAEQDVWTQLFGLLEEAKGGEIPVVAVSEVSDAGGMQTDRTLFNYGTWEGAPQANQVLGDEGVNEFMRIEGITVEGIEG